MQLLTPSTGPKVVIGIALDSGGLEAVSLARTNGSVQIRKRQTAALALNPLTSDPELAGREIRKQLDAAQIHGKPCLVSVPLDWVLTLIVKLPDLPEADLASFLQIEAERGFPYPPEALINSFSRFSSPAGDRYATIAAVPRDNVSRLEATLAAAQLKPLGITLGIAALDDSPAAANEAAVTLLPGEESVGILLKLGGGIVALRNVKGAIVREGGVRRAESAQIARELRITLGQLPQDIREAFRTARIIGRGDIVDQLVRDLRPTFESHQLRTEVIATYDKPHHGLKIPPGTDCSQVISATVHRLSGRPVEFEFLPPKISAWQKLTARYSSRKLVWAGGAAAGLAAAVALAFLFQQWQLSSVQSKWNAISRNVNELDDLQHKIRRFRPWFDESYTSLTILKRLAESFPDTGSVTAKTLQIKESAIISCSGSASDRQALLKTLDRLRTSREVSEVQLEQVRGKTPMQFTFNFHWGNGVANER